MNLKRIEYQAARITANPNLDVMSTSNRNLMRAKGTDLITAIIEYFDSALCYFSHSLAGKFNR